MELDMSMQQYIAHIKELNATEKFVEPMWEHVKKTLKQKIKSFPSLSIWQITISDFKNVNNCSKLNELLKDSDSIKRFVTELNASENRDTIRASFKPTEHFSNVVPNQPMGIAFEIIQQH